MSSSVHNVTNHYILRRMVLWSGFPYVFQLFALATLITLAVVGWGQLPPRGTADKLYAQSNIVSLVVWGLFWPAVIWATVLLGRVWCTVCPLELVSNAAERLGRAMRIPQPAIGSWLRAGWFVLIAYALLQMLVAGLHLHRTPAYTSIFLWALLAMAGVTGLVYADRAFCRGFCPVSLLLKTYGRGGTLAVRVEAPQICDLCGTRDCAAPANRTRPDARSCPTLLNPATLSSSENCLMCLQCVKACPSRNMGLFARWPFSRLDGRAPLAPWTTTIFVLMLSGFVTSEIASEWTAARELFLRPPTWLASEFGFMAWDGWIEGIWTLAVLPVVYWTLLASVLLLAGAAQTTGEAWRSMTLPMAVVIAAGQMAKALAKAGSWAGYLPGSLQDPEGISTSVGITAGAFAAPPALLSLRTVSVVGMALMLSALWLANRESRLAQAGFRNSALLPQSITAALFAFVIFGWGFLQ